MEAVLAAKAALFAKLPPDGHARYWDALSRFLCFKITKTEFTTLCGCDGPCVELHNQLILALLNSAMHAPPPAPADGHAALALPTPSDAAAGIAAHGGSSGACSSEPLDFVRRPEPTAHGAPIKPEPLHVEPLQQHGASAAINACGAALPAASAAAVGSKLALRIKRDAPDSGGDGPPTADPDAAARAAAEINALHDRCAQVARAHGVGAVHPEAVVFLHRALKVHLYRLIAAGVQSREATGGPPPGKRARAAPAGTTLTRDHLAGAMRRAHQPNAAWTLPPCQRTNAAFATVARNFFL